MDPSKKKATQSRKDEVLRMLKEQTSASISEIATKVGVSEMTVRRDLQMLSETGHVIRIPGGARITRSITFERDFADRLQKSAQAKDRIGRLAASLIKEGDSVVLDSGTTTLSIARHMRRHRNVVVFTFSLAVLEELMPVDSVRVELTGGAYRRNSHDLIGSAVNDSLAKVCASKVFFGAAAVSFSRGVMVYDPEAPRALLQSGSERILVVDSSKIGTDALYHFSPISACDLILVDGGIKPEHLHTLRQEANVMVAE
jgi:DeoR/GlpR family transcriptional regulator of sugar metabolism